MKKQIALILMLGTLWVSGCGGNKEPAGGPTIEPPTIDADQTANVHKNESAAREAVVDLGTPSEIPVDDPLSDGWRSEVVADRVNTQLKHLGDLLAKKSSSEFSIESIVTPSVSSDPIRPLNLDEAFSDEQTKVRRMRAGESEATTSSRHTSSPKEFQEDVSRTLEELKIDKNIRSKFKVFDVDVDSDKATTGVYVHISGEADGSHSQLNATWQCTWSHADSEHPLLSQLSIEKHEEVLITGDGSGFEDRTHAVLDGEVFQQQLQHGVDYWLDRIAASTAFETSSAESFCGR